MRVLVTGAAGFVGRAFVDAAPPGVEVVAAWHRTPPSPGVAAQRVDLTDARATAAMLAAVRPEVVVHTAYDTRDLARGVVGATAAVADAAAAVGAGLVHLSSDVVFCGEDPPYAEHDPPRPASAYGRAKAAAEAEVDVAVPDAAVVRTSLVLTPETLDPRTAFVADGLRAGRPVACYEDEIRMPVHRDDLVAGLWALVGLPRADRAGPWHLAGEVALSRYDLGLLVCAAVGGDPGLVQRTRSPRDVDDPRPRDLRLTCGRARATLGWRPRDVRSAYPVREPAVPSPVEPGDHLDGQ